MPFSKSAVAANSGESESRWIDYGAVATAAAFLPSLIVYYLQLWVLPHYQFFPLVFLGAACLARRAIKEPIPLTVSAVPAPTMFVLGAMAALFVFGLGVFLNSPWLSTIAAGIAGLTWLYGRGGRSEVRRFAPACLLLATTLRLPLGFDEELILRLQRLTARLANLTLDVLGTPHLLAGNVIEIPGHRLLVEEACSGVNSLFSTLVCTVFYLLWTRRHPLMGLLLLASVPIWVLFGNAARVVAVAQLRFHGNIHADVGRLHDALGLAVFLGILGFVYSTERLLTFYAAVLPPDVPNATPAASPSDAKTPDHKSRRWEETAWRYMAVACWGLAMLQLPDLRGRFGEIATTLRSIEVAELTAEFVPTELDGRRRLSYQKTRRDRNSAFGEYSQTWTSADAETVALWSFDYPFLGWHELPSCYSAQGWEIVSRDVRRRNDLEFVEVRLFHPQRKRHALLAFALLDLTGRILPAQKRDPIERLGTRWAARWHELLHRNPDTNGIHASCQFQGLLEAYGPVDENTSQTFIAAFVELLAKLSRT